jgi:hypothetical protein
MNPFTSTQVVPPGKDLDADLIFVLAGLESRKRLGLQLFRENFAPRLLLSVGRFELRKLPNLNPPVPVNLLELASPIPPQQRHFFVCYEADTVSAQPIPVGRFGTFTEMDALAVWLRERPGIRSILVVSSAAHIPRIRMCCRALLPRRLRIRFVEVPEDHGGLLRWFTFWRSGGTKWIFGELIKIPVYRVLLWCRAATPQHTRGKSSAGE